MACSSTAFSGAPYRFLFGPVASRRLGRSLGIDLVVPKTCSEACLFCEAGRTTDLTVDRREYVPVDGVLGEVADWLAHGGEADNITLSGAGEPTLHARFGDVLRGVRGLCAMRRVLLSNGTLFWLPAVRRDAAEADVVKVSLSAWDQASFERVNRPHASLRLETVLEGLRAFRAAFAGELWVETMLVKGVNDAPGDVARIAARVKELRPDRVHLNTVVRPPAEPSAQAVEAGRLAELAGLFEPCAEVATGGARPCDGAGAPEAERIRAMLARRGCRLDEIARGLGADEAGVARLLREMEARGEVAAIAGGHGVFYVAKRAGGAEVDSRLSQG